MALRIEDYALIGDCHTAALVGKDGSIDWLCLPRFDSGACFAALLGTPENGRWLLRPADEVRHASRRYRGDTLILETDFETDSGAVTIIDFMPPRTEQPDLVRIVVGRRGQVRMKMETIFRCDYGSIVPWVVRTDYGQRAVAGPDTLLLRTGVELRGQDFTTVAEFTVSEGERVPFSLTWHLSHLAESPPLDVEDALATTEQWWNQWSGRCRCEHRDRDSVMRSLITLKALTYEPSGGLVAAATTSLPEAIGSVRNWDYRFCWLRDATFTLYALMESGYEDEAKAWRDWLLRAIAGQASQIQIMYGLAGERRLTELELGWLPGYENSKPVRIGNAAHGQLQLDVYGELLDMLYQGRRKGWEHNSTAWQLELELLGTLAKIWPEPDEGIWEVRGVRRHFTHSKMMAWVAFDRGIKSAEGYGLEGPVDDWRAIRDQIHEQICRNGFDAELGSFVQFYGSKKLDASLLMMPLLGFLPIDDPRVVGTIEAIRQGLLVDGLIARYSPDPHVDGLPSREGTFLACSFWLADCLTLMGRQPEAEELYQRLMQIRNDVGLMAEEYDPHDKRQLGNFPQAFSHVGLINTAHNLSRSVGPAVHRNES